MQRTYGVKMVVIASIAVLWCVGCGGSDEPSPQSDVTVESTATTTLTETTTVTVQPAPKTPPRTTQQAPRPPVSTQPKMYTDPVILARILLDVGNSKANEPVGCGDALVLVSYPLSQPYSDKVKATMEALLAQRRDKPGEAESHNPLHQSWPNLKFVSSSINGDTVTVRLTGRVVSGGVCDDPRIVAQLKRTAAVAAGVPNAIVLIDGVAIETYLSQK